MTNQARINRMCEAAVGQKLSVRCRDGKFIKNWIVVAVEFAGWRNRGCSKIAQFLVTLENPPQYPNRKQKTAILESL